MGYVVDLVGERLFLIFVTGGTKGAADEPPWAAREGGPPEVMKAGCGGFYPRADGIVKKSSF